MDNFKETPLVARHLERNALMAPFGGWNMPIQYEGILAEHRWCRENVALFDVCHMGEFLYRGDIVAGGLEDLFTVSVVSIPEGRSRYGFLLNERGGIVDDLIVFRLAPDKVMIVVNAATSDNDFRVIGSRLRGCDQFEDVSGNTAKLDPQGPLARDVLADLAGAAVRTLPYYRFAEMELVGVKALVSRTGYTGELGYEIFLPAERVVALWDRLLQDPRVRPAGLGARDLLRLEVGYSLYGNDLDETITPLEAGLGAFVDFNKEFVGRDALLAQRAEGPGRLKVAFRVASRRSPRHHYEIWHGEEKAGITTSGGYSPMLGCGIGLGLVHPEAAPAGTKLTIRHENLRMPAESCDLPFYRGGTVRG